MVILFGAASSLLLTGCSKNGGDQIAQPAGQVIAHVGTDDVTIQEFENEFRWLNVPANKRDDATVKRVLQEVVSRKYLVQQALAAKLDREPTVHLDLMRAKEQVLAGAIMQRNLVANAGSIGKSEIERYMSAHPLQFAKREILNVEQITFPVSTNVQSVVDATKDFKTLDEVDQRLTDMGVPHNRSKGSLDSGDLTDDFIAALQAKKADDIFLMRSATTGNFFKVVGEQLQPLKAEEAADHARQMIRIELQRAESRQAETAADANAKYEGEYAKIMAEQTARKKDTSAKN
jgi:EpsD family peptidyl-prolyl cis-trans isomerase